MHGTEFHQGAVSGFLHRPAEQVRDGIVLTHGAGGNSQMPLLAVLARAFSAEGMTVLRCDLPFRQKRPRGVPSPTDAAEDRAGLKDAVGAMRAIVAGRVFLGGQSYGGRQASMLAAEEPGLVDGLLLLSYPLHPPGKPERPRTDHFPSLRTPALFVHGSRDPFATTEELRTAIALIPARTALIELEHAGHELTRGRFDGAALVVQPFRKLIEGAA